MKKVSRRLFMGITGASVVGWQLIGCSDDKTPKTTDDAGPDGGDCGYVAPPAWVANDEAHYGTVSSTICPYCGCGCGALVTTNADGVVVNIEGDPDHPINKGSLCSKGASLYQLNRDVMGGTNTNRQTTVMHRAAGASEWEEVTWDEAIPAIAAKVKSTRDTYWTSTDGSGRTVNRTDAIACLGGASLDTEECYLLSKAMRSMGLVYIEHQARI